MNPSPSPLRRALLAALAASALVLLGPAGAASAHHYDNLLPATTACGGTDQTNPSSSVTEQQQAMVCLHNHARRRSGRVNLASYPDLRVSSRRKSADQLRCQDISHTPCGDDIWRRIRETGYMQGCYGVAENVAYGTGSLGSARSIMRRWLHSDNHRPNILNASYRDLGIGLVEGTFDGRSNSQIWTGHFGYRC